YSSACVMDESEFTIKLGDVVYVLDENRNITPNRPTVNQNSQNNSTLEGKIKVRFGQALSIRHVSGAKGSHNVFIHVRWLAPGCDTILQEMASMKEFFLTDACDTILADEIYGVGRLTQLGLNGKNVDFDESMTTIIGEDEFFIRFKYDYRDGTFRDLTDAGQLCSFQPQADSHKNPGYCSNCRLNFGSKRLSDMWIYEEDPEKLVPRIHCRTKGWYIYAHEFVYIQPDDP